VPRKIFDEFVIIGEEDIHPDGFSFREDLAIHLALSPCVMLSEVVGATGSAGALFREDVHQLRFKPIHMSRALFVMSDFPDFVSDRRRDVQSIQVSEQKINALLLAS
jgi:hypothetical protein